MAKKKIDINALFAQAKAILDNGGNQAQCRKELPNEILGVKFFYLVRFHALFPGLKIAENETFLKNAAHNVLQDMGRRFDEESTRW